MNVFTFTESSPFLVFMTVPSTPTQSPRSMSSTNRAKASSPSSALFDEELQLAGAVAQGREHELALRAAAHDAAGDAHDVVARRADLDAVVPVLADLGQGVRAVEADRVRIVAPGAHRLDLREPRGALVVAGASLGLHQAFRSKMIRKP